MFSRAGFAATILVPLATPGRFLGLLAVSVYGTPQRLRLTGDMLDRLSGVVARLGGDEFAILVSAESGADVARLSERIAAAFGYPFLVDGHEIRVGASVGRSVFPVHANDAESLLRHADAAMFEAKRRRHDSATAVGSLPLTA